MWFSFVPKFFALTPIYLIAEDGFDEHDAAPSITHRPPIKDFIAKADSYRGDNDNAENKPIP